MSKPDLFNEVVDPEWKNTKCPFRTHQMPSRQSLTMKFDIRMLQNSEYSRADGTRCDALSSFSKVNPKQALKNGAEKLSQTFNNVKARFGTLSQKIKKPTKRRQPLVNMDSPKSPVTPYTRSRAALGRTPTKLYSPFSIDTPTEKENFTCRAFKSKDSKSKPRRIKYESGICESNGGSTKTEIRLSNDLLQAQIGIYEFQSVANGIVQGGFRD